MLTQRLLVPELVLLEDTSSVRMKWRRYRRRFIRWFPSDEEDVVDDDTAVVRF